VTPSGLFVGSRKFKDLINYSGFQCLDFDDLPDPEQKKNELTNDPYCYAVFISPSGTGLKVFIKVGMESSKHNSYYISLIQYFKNRYDVIADKSCKDVTRLMFLSYDENMIVNEDSKVWKIEPGNELNYVLAKSTLTRQEAFTPGNRNNFVYLLASACCKKGISKEFVEIAIVAEYTTEDFPEMEVLATIKSAFNSDGNVPTATMPEKKTEGLSALARVEEYINKKYDIRFNVVSTKIEWRKKTPDSAYQELNENSLYRELQHENLNISLAKLSSLMQSDFVSNYNPFVEFFEGLAPWKESEDPDYVGKLCGYIPVVEQERFNRHFRKMLVRTIACALNDKVFNKQVFVLVHDMQNSGKSSFCRWLCPPALSSYITENINTDKDSAIALATNLFINMDELATLSKAEINSLKSFISRDKTNVRLPFAKKATVMPRRASFIGSTNKEEILTDETGSVRWLCFALSGMINFNYREDVDINDVWRQAYTLYNAGFEYQLTPDEILENERANQAFQVICIEMQLIPEMFSPSSKDGGGTFITATDIHINLSRQFENCKTNIHSIGRAMKLLGFEKDSQYQENRKYSKKGYFVKIIGTNSTR
jgi:hypothetical protein